MFQLSPSDADPYWYLGRFVGIVGITYNLLIVIGVDLVPSSRIEFMFGIFLLALVPIIERMSDSTPLYKEIDFEDE